MIFASDMYKIACGVSNERTADIRTGLETLIEQSAKKHHFSCVYVFQHPYEVDIRSLEVWFKKCGFDFEYQVVQDPISSVQSGRISISWAR